MFENKPTKLTLESSGVTLTSEMCWDVPMDDLLNSFYGLCVGATWHPRTILESMAEFSEEKLESLEGKATPVQTKPEGKPFDTNSIGNSIQEKRWARQEANREILKILSKVVEDHPDIRFGQALVNTGIIQFNEKIDKVEVKDPFNEESIDMLRRIQQ